MVERILTTAVQEAIRIAETYLPRASHKRRAALAMEILEVTNLCEAELVEDIGRGLDDLVAVHQS